MLQVRTESTELESGAGDEGTDGKENWNQGDGAAQEVWAARGWGTGCSVWDAGAALGSLRGFWHSPRGLSEDPGTATGMPAQP